MPGPVMAKDYLNFTRGCNPADPASCRPRPQPSAGVLRL